MSKFCRALRLNGGGTERGDATFVWQERVQTRATQMTHMPIPQTTLFVAVKIIGSMASTARHLLVTEKKRTPRLGPPHLKMPDFGVNGIFLVFFRGNP